MGLTLCGGSKNHRGHRALADIACSDCQEIIDMMTPEELLNRTMIEDRSKFQETAIRVHYDPIEGLPVADGKAIDWAKSLEPGGKYDTSSEIAVSAIGLLVVRGEIDPTIVEITYYRDNILNGMYYNQYGRASNWFDGGSYDITYEIVMTACKMSKAERAEKKKIREAKK